MNRECDAGAFCLQRPQCEYRCHLTGAVLTGEAHFENTVITQPELTRKIKPWPVIPDDIDPVPDTWRTIGAWMLGAIMTALLVICLGLFFTGLWVWSLLI